MLDPKVFDDISRRMTENLPRGLQSLQEDMQRNFRTGLESALNRLNLVTREEFDVQQAVLQRTRAKLKALEARVAELEAARRGATDSIVGLPELAVKESRDRVRGAIINGRFSFPAGRVTINLAPADLPKEGGRFDLPIAIGILAASGQVRADQLPHLELLGELALTGALRPVSAVLPAALAAREAGRALVLPRANADEAALVEGLDILPASTCWRSART
jgi:BMFP domain-containing protein YqiC